MPDMLAIISKAIFEKQAVGLSPGDVLSLDIYRSNSRALDPLEDGGNLFLVTVRPPDEALWLVAVLRSPEQDDDGWRSAANRIPITDVTSLIPSIRFASGKGIQAAKGALGMSLQTPRALTAEDAASLLRAAKGSRPAINLTAHGTGAPMPCLCRQCLPESPERAEVDGLRCVRSQVEVEAHVLYFWMPEELSADAAQVTTAVRSALVKRLPRLAR
ncbi:hypothetical protein DRW03_11060 [Corallococcus sp. H22C18031201]|nr:hypothetical protein DRW03_11060 [Corallococcus sp. H22C18031201]